MEGFETALQSALRKTWKITRAPPAPPLRDPGRIIDADHRLGIDACQRATGVEVVGPKPSAGVIPRGVLRSGAACLAQDRPQFIAASPKP
jgi:hypothetical protein